MKSFDVKDGCGIHDIAIPAGIVPVIITGRSSKILENEKLENTPDSVIDDALPFVLKLLYDVIVLIKQTHRVI